MANLKSQIKRNRQNEKRRLRNRDYRGSARSAVNQARLSMDSGTPESKETLMRAVSLLDKAAERGSLHPNNAARRKGRLMKRLAALNAQPAQMKIEEPVQSADAALEESVADSKKQGATKKGAAAKTTAAKKPAGKKAAKK